MKNPFAEIAAEELTKNFQATLPWWTSMSCEDRAATGLILATEARSPDPWHAGARQPVYDRGGVAGAGAEGARAVMRTPCAICGGPTERGQWHCEPCHTRWLLDPLRHYRPLDTSPHPLGAPPSQRRVIWLWTEPKAVGRPSYYTGKTGRPWEAGGDISPWQENAIRAMEDCP